MTYQYLTLEMIDAKRNAGFVDQKKFKTADHYVSDSFNLQVYLSFKVTENMFVHC